MNPLIQCKTTILPLLIAGVFVCFGLLPNAQAVNPPPDGGYFGGNTAEGFDALLSLTSGAYNTGIGAFSLLSLTDGALCTGVGAGTLLSNTAANGTAIGAGALLSNTLGEGNTATGAFALFSNTEGDFNTANGEFALFSNTTGSYNTAIGAGALDSNTTGTFNTAVGVRSLFSDTTGNDNTAVGTFALQANNAGDNTAIGSSALRYNTMGDSNTAVGRNALDNATGSANIALGVDAGGSLTTGSNNIDIGNTGVAGDSDTIRIGGLHSRTFIAGIHGTTTGIANAIPVLIDSAGQLGTMSSSRRFKKDIQPMDKASEAILALKPVTFHYKSDNTATRQFGLIAEEVAEIHPDLVVRDENGEIYSVRYEAINAMLLNEFLKEHRKVEQLEKQIDALTAGLQKVSAQLEASKPAPQVVLNSQ